MSNKKGDLSYSYIVMIVLGIIGIILILFIFSGGFGQLSDKVLGLLNQTQ